MNNLIKIDKREFIQKFDPAVMVMNYRNVKSIQDAIDQDPNGVAFYVKNLGYDTVSAVIELHLVALNQSINVGQLLTVYQIKEIAIEVIASFYYLSIVEIAFIFRKIKRGDYGKLYGALNMVDILGFFSSYCEERAQVFINKSTKDLQNDHTLRTEERRTLERHEKLINKLPPNL